MEKEITFRRAQLSESGKLHELMVMVYEAMDDKSMFVCDNEQYIKDHIEEQGFIIVAEDKDKPVGLAMFRFPGFAEDNLGHDIGLEEADFLKVSHAESALVHPDYRGMHLQARMIEYGINLIDHRKYRYLCATVAPDNVASRKTLEGLGFIAVAKKEKYGGLTRLIMKKELTIETKAPKLSNDEIKEKKSLFRPSGISHWFTLAECILLLLVSAFFVYYGYTVGGPLGGVYAYVIGFPLMIAFALMLIAFITGIICRKKADNKFALGEKANAVSLLKVENIFMMINNFLISAFVILLFGQLGKIVFRNFLADTLFIIGFAIELITLVITCKKKAAI